MLSGTTNNFYYDIGNILYNGNHKKLSVELIDCIVNKNYRTFAVGTTVYDVYASVPFYTSMIKVYINFKHNNTLDGALPAG